MIIFATLLLVPALIALGFFLFSREKITLKEFGLQMVLMLVVAGISAAIISDGDSGDVEIMNGQVTRKYSERVSCEHSYRCHCYTTCSGSGKTKSCSEHCSTCYDHSYDVDWNVDTNSGYNFEIERVNRQGTQEPSRWTSVQVGDPVAWTHGYTNWIKGAPDTLFRKTGLIEKYKGKLPAYPRGIYDYYNLQRVVLVNGALVPPEWSRILSNLNGQLGPKKQVNIILVVVKNLGQEYFEALKEHWLGGKKNDVIVVLGTTDNLNISWVSVASWSKAEMTKIAIRDEIMAAGVLDQALIFPVIERNVIQHFKRREMKDFEYLRSSIVPTPTQYIVTIVIGTLLAIGMSLFCFHHDLFEEDRRNKRWTTPRGNSWRK